MQEVPQGCRDASRIRITLQSAQINGMCFFTLKTSALVIVLIMQIAIVACKPADCLARNDVTRGCKFGEYLVPRGQARNLQNPCVQVSCAADGTSTTVRGCPFEGGQNPHPGAPGPAAPGQQFPYCCNKCNAA
ncbi:uncharacterized protein LOC142591139 [Dermacentor variabilis]|uniref:uncharacterized protein LOC142591139 n=1 Tax=Dermacentor variabilis TaxID=34621 RepID=UPI003F5C0C18